jgi:hypothetical protein
MSDDPRRQQPITIRWFGMTGTLLIDNESWGAVEWSEKQQAWCIEDAEGRCLSHHSHIHGADHDKAGAVALAEAMIRDGRMPSPDAARTARSERLQRDRERRAKQPAEIRRREKREERSRLFAVEMDADYQDRSEPPLYEIIADAFDLRDPELWRSNSFARLRERLLVTVQAAIAKLEYGRVRGWGDKEESERKLTRAREILALLRPDDRAPIDKAQLAVAFRKVRALRRDSNDVGWIARLIGHVDPAFEGLRGDKELWVAIKELLAEEPSP